MKINFNIIKEDKKKPKDTTFNKSDIVYSSDFDEMVQIINRQRIKKVRGTRGKIRPGDSGAGVDFEDPTPVSLDDTPIATDSGDGQDPTLSPGGLNSPNRNIDPGVVTQRVINTDHLEEFKGDELRVYPRDAEEDDYDQTRKITSYEYKDANSDVKYYGVSFESVSVDDATSVETKTVIGSIVNVPGKGYLITNKEIKQDTVLNIDESREEGLNLHTYKNVSSFTIDSKKEQFKNFSYTYENALKILFSLKGTRLDLDDENFKQFKDLPENFEDASGIPLRKYEYNSKQRSDKVSMEFYKKIKTTVNTEISNKKLDEKDMIEDNDTDAAMIDKAGNVFGDEARSTFGRLAGATIKDVASLAAMIKVETGGNMKYSPFGVAQVAFSRVDDTSNWGNDLSKIVKGPDVDGKPGTQWNSGETYIRKFKSHYTNILNILYHETDLGKRLQGENKSLNNEGYTNLNSSQLNMYHGLIDYALSAITRRAELKSRYRGATGFIHPQNMPESATKFNTIKVDFNKQKLTMDGEEIEFNIENNPKNFFKPGQRNQNDLDGVRYVSKNVATKIINKRAFFYPNESALFH